MKAKYLLVLLIPVIGGLIYYYRPQKKAVTPSPSPVIFQPDSQILGNAVAGGIEKAVKENGEPNLASIASAAPGSDPVVTASSAPKYQYSNKTCGDAYTVNNSNRDFACLAKYYQDLVKNYGADTAFADIKQRFKENQFVVSQCHPLMHVIGREAAKSYATVSEAYKHGDSFCWSGYYHGILESVINRVGIANLPAQLNTICNDIPGKATYNFDYYNCVHGLGHGIMNLLNDDVPNSLTMCDNVTGDWEQQSCYSGVFMENIIAADTSGNPDHHTVYLKASDPLYPCDIVKDRYKFQCYLGQTSYALQVRSYQFKPVVELCTGVADPYRQICFQSIGRDAANQALHVAATTRDTCKLATDPTDYNNCIVGAVKEIISYYHSETQALDFCSILEGTADLCRTTADSYYSHL